MKRKLEVKRGISIYFNNVLFSVYYFNLLVKGYKLEQGQIFNCTSYFEPFYQFYDDITEDSEEIIKTLVNLMLKVKNAAVLKYEFDPWYGVYKPCIYTYQDAIEAGLLEKPETDYDKPLSYWE